MPLTGHLLMAVVIEFAFDGAVKPEDGVDPESQTRCRMEVLGVPTAISG